MSRLGTCKHAQQVRKRWAVDSYGRIMSEVDLPESYTCGWLAQFKTVPPAIARFAFDVREHDCDRCGLYEPAADLAVLSK